MTVVGWADVFTRKEYKEIVLENFSFYKKKGLNISAYVIMSNHIHLIGYAQENAIGLSGLIRDLKKAIARSVLNIIDNPKESRREWLKLVFAYHAKFNKRNSRYQFWIQDNRPIHLESPNFIRQKLDYIHLNPVRAGLVDDIQDYVYSSARNYADKDPVYNEINVLDIQGSDIGYIKM